MRIAITGARGRFGIPLVRRALDAGHTVVTIDRASTPAMARPSAAVADHTFDVADYDALVLALRGCEAVIHTAAFLHPWAADEPQVHNANVVGSYNVLAAAQANGIRRVCLSSSINAIGAFYSATPRYDYFPVDEDHPCYAEDSYSLSKWIAEEQARAFSRRVPGMSVISVRLHRLVDEAHLQTSMEQETARSTQDRKDLWGYTPIPMAVEAALNAVVRDLAGAEVVYVVAEDTRSSTDSGQLAKDYYPEVPLRQPMDGRRSFYDCAKYKQLLA